jgi:hypothetical protein
MKLNATVWLSIAIIFISYSVSRLLRKSQKMVFILGEDNVISIAESEATLQGVCEGIDIGNGVYRFFDEAEKPLMPEFIKPNKQEKLFGIVR